MRASAPFGPITATLRSDEPVNGSSDPWLRASTKPSAAAARSSAAISASDHAVASREATRSASRTSRPTRTSTSGGSSGLSGPGIARSTAASALRVAPQSDITTPS